MSLSADCIASLDAALAEAGTTIKLRRFVGLPPNQTWIDVDARAVARGPKAEELIAGHKQTDWFVIMSMTEITTAQWPGGQPPGQIHPELPRDGAAGDRAIILGKPHQIESVNPFPMGDSVVRVEFWALG